VPPPPASPGRFSPAHAPVEVRRVSSGVPASRGKTILTNAQYGVDLSDQDARHVLFS